MVDGTISHSNDGGSYGKFDGGTGVLVAVPCLYTMKGGDIHG